MNHLKSKRTGNVRLKPKTIKVGWFATATVLVHESEISYLATECIGGQVDCETRIAWVATQPEWLLETSDGKVAA